MTQSTTSPGRPNIIVILSDDMGFSDIGCFGGEIRTPSLDRLAREGMRFSSMYNAARCCPTRAALLTGCYPHRVGMGHMIGNLGTPAYQGRLADECITLAEALKASGYRTMMSGKWHVGGDYDARDTAKWTPNDRQHPTPIQRGFEKFYGTLDGAGSYFNPHYLMEDSKRTFPDREGYYITDAFSRKAVDMIRTAQAEEAPFFLYLAYTAPHWPLHAPEEDIARNEGRYRKGWDYIRGARFEELMSLGMLRDGWQLSPRDAGIPEWNEVRHKDWEDRRMAIYAAQVELMDRGIGHVIDELERLAIADDTVVMFLSDNGGCAEYLAEDGWARFYAGTTADGEPVKLGNRPDLKPGDAATFMSYEMGWSNVSNSPFRKHKRFVHEGGISTPFIVRWPGTVPPNTITHTECHVIDILPTCLDMASTSAPTERAGQLSPRQDGESFVDLLKGRTRPRQRPLFWEHMNNSAVRMGEWKLVRTAGSDWELYNMDEDRTELNDLAARNRPVVQRLVSDYREWEHYCHVVDWGSLLPAYEKLYAGGKLA